MSDYWKKDPRRSLWQHDLWGKFQESICRKTWVIEDKSARALVIRHPLPFGLCWLEVPRGPLAMDESAFSTIMEQVKTLGTKQKAIFVRVSTFEPNYSDNLKGSRVSSHDHHPQTSLVLGLSKSEDDILAQMKQKGRYNIKLAEKHGVKVSATHSMEAYYKLLCNTANRDGFSVHGKAYYEKLLKSLGSHAQLLVAEHEGRVIAGGIFVYLDDWGIYYYGASSSEHRNLMAPYLIQWEAIKEAKKRGCKHYDFLGIAPVAVAGSLRLPTVAPHPWAGVTDFKLKFGGEVVSYPPAREVVLRPFWDLAYRFYKKLR